MSLNANLRDARRNKNDEFYTQLPDIENELKHYKAHFQGKVVYCNCDDPTESNFYRYFSANFVHLGLKRLIASCYRNDSRDLFSQHDREQAAWIEYTGNPRDEGLPRPEDAALRRFERDGDFRSPESIELLQKADIVVTNPPFSLFREYVAQLVEHGKRFLIVGSQNAVTYKEIFPLIKENRMWLGMTPKGKDMLFDVPSEYAQELRETKKEGSAYRLVDGVVKGRLGNAAWFTNLDHAGRHEELPLFRRYTPEDYPHYDNYDAINVDKVAEIPVDWGGAMGVPVTLLDKYNPDQFKIVGIPASADRYGLKTKKYTLADAPNYS